MRLPSFDQTLVAWAITLGGFGNIDRVKTFFPLFNGEFDALAFRQTAVALHSN